MRLGYTTGTCAAAAAQAAAQLLLLHTFDRAVSVTVPRGDTVTVEARVESVQPDSVCCSVVKDAGDDPDVTDSIRVLASVRRTEEVSGGGCAKVRILGGEGVGIVTKPGLEQPVGEAAINAVPRQMIADAAAAAAAQAGCADVLEVTISVPGGREIAERTFNPRLGITGGISILGTTGIVEPMSTQALLAAIEAEIRVRAAEYDAANGRHKKNEVKRLVLTPGNYGHRFYEDMRLDAVPEVICSNYVGHAIDYAVQQGFTQILIIGHIGKLIKVAGGIMNTHSHNADCRAELIAAHAAACGYDCRSIRRILSAATTDACFDILDEVSPELTRQVIERIAARMQFYLDSGTKERALCGACFFSSIRGPLGSTETAKKLIAQWRQQQ